MEITTAELREALDLLLAHAERGGNVVLRLHEDYYWDIPGADRYSVSEAPAQPTVGQLSEDLSAIRKILDQEAPPLNFALVWLSSLLRYAGETLGEEPRGPE